MTQERYIEILTEHLGSLPNFEKLLEWLKENGFFTAPASTKYHGNHPGGLFEHSWSVATVLSDFTARLPIEWQRPESPWIVGFLHDICKCDSYKQNADGGYDYNNDTLYKGHGDKSLMILSSLITLTEEEAVCIRFHMGAFTEKEEWRDYTNAIHKYPNVLFAHTADMVAAHIMEVERWVLNEK